MELFVILAYCLADDAIKKVGLIDNIQTRVSAARILTTAIVAARFYGANHKVAQDFLFEHRYFHNKLSKSQFCRRLHAIPGDVFNQLQVLFASYAKSMNESYEFAIDSFPVPCIAGRSISPGAALCADAAASTETKPKKHITANTILVRVATPFK